MKIVAALPWDKENTLIKPVLGCKSVAKEFIFLIQRFSLTQVTIRSIV